MDDTKKLSEIFKALSDQTRLKMVKILSNSSRPMCVNALTNRMDISQSAVSQHLKVLKQAGLVRPERRGNFIHYTFENTAEEIFQQKLVQNHGEEFLIVDNNGMMRIGSNFWANQGQLEILERQLEDLQEKTAEIETLISDLKK